MTLGETVTANQPLVEIQNLNTVWIEAQAPSLDVPAISSSRELKGIATVLADSGIQFPVALSRVGPTVNESTRSQPVWFTPEATTDSNAIQSQLRVGSLLTVSLPVGASNSRLAIPSSAILRDGVHHFSFVQKQDGYIERRRVAIGRSDGHYTEVVSGIVAGELVVTVGGRELQTAFASLR